MVILGKLAVMVTKEYVVNRVFKVFLVTPA